ncbi:putative LppA-like lipoprotein [Amycolatopsis sulphurea]|uniref:Putative LppA-like lipoprotein n=1 Tax=Amycolatopsis sulphurea TaxID=76022 RepID=A0A2A9G1U1_9PSEU|nr:LppA family lipoprotein [Amycolatopsis sulphurea]PFG57123.1 putative LppA-like lipoprotein [Amycolatopsis sulphurea]
MQSQQQFTELMTRPTITEMVARYEQMRGEIRTQLTRDLGVTQWAEQPGSSNYTGCAREFPDVNVQDVQKQHPATWYSPTPISPENWEKAKGTVSSVARRYGFDKTALVIDSANNLQFDLNDKYRSELSFGSAKNTILALTTGCHLTAAAKQRGEPSPAQ